MAREKLDYGQSENGNFKVVDRIGVPHLFCITPRHVVYAADRHGGMLTEHAIKYSGAPCGVKGCTLSYMEHKMALLVSCLVDVAGGEPDKDGKVKMNPELHKYLQLIAEQTEEEGYAGYAFLDSRKGGKHPEMEE